MEFAFQTDPETFRRTIYTVLGMFGAGAVLTLVLGRFDFQRIRNGELGARYIGWLILTPVYLLVLFTNTIIGVSLVLVALMLCNFEYSKAAQLHTGERLFLQVAAAVTLLIVLLKPTLFSATPVLVLFLLTLIPIMGNAPERLHGRVRLVLYGYMYVVWSLSHGLLMLQLPDGKGLLLVALVGCALADIGAYVVGKQIGRTVIAPSINPNKAYEGILGDLLGAAIAVALFRYIIPFYNLPSLVGLVLVIGIGSSWGDILSSMAKRTSGIKDWGTIVPGHGGLLDRLNSLIVVMPLLYYGIILFLPS